MFIIGNQGVCPRGYICINNYNVLIILLIVMGIIYFFNKQIYLSLYNKMLENRDSSSQITSNPPAIHINPDSQNGYGYNNHQKGAVIEAPFNNPTRQPNHNHNQQEPNNSIDIDRVLINDPLYPPLSRNYHEDPTGRIEHPHKPGRRGMPINIETRGSGGDFQQIGILSKNVIEKDDKTPGNNTDSNILPLYGKPTYRGSNRWLYYTETDKYNPIKIPINVNDRDCTDDTGCDELYNGNEVTIPSYNGVFKVQIYKFNKPRYIPLDNPRDIHPLPFT